MHNVKRDSSIESLVFRSALLLLLILVTGLFSCVVLEERSVNLSNEDQKNEEEQSTPWYNRAGFRPIFGDFEKAVKLELPSDALELVQRGQYLVTAPASCGACHGATLGDVESPLSGGRMMRDRFGLVRAANITPDKKTGIGEWNYVEVMRAVRSSIDREGRPISLDLHQRYRWLADRDLKAIALYLLSLDPVESRVERRSLGGVERNKWIIFSQHGDSIGYIPQLPQTSARGNGFVLAYNIAGCYSCHTKPSDEYDYKIAFAGGAEALQGEGLDRENLDSVKGLFQSIFTKEELSDSEQESEVKALIASQQERDMSGVEEAAGVDSIVVEEIKETSPEESPQKGNREHSILDGEFPVGGPDIRSRNGGALFQWSVDELVEYLSSGRTPAGIVRDGRLCPWPYFNKMTDTDKRSVATFIKSM